MQVYYLPIICPTWNKTDSMLLNVVSPERQKKIFKYVHDIDKKLSLYAALITRMGISVMTNSPARGLLFSHELDHKPLCLSYSNIDFSFSHTGNAILCCISSVSTVGADIEKIGLAPFDIMPQIFNPVEIEYIEQSQDYQKTFRFYEIWTRKEAYTKQLGIGIVCNPADINTLSAKNVSHIHTWKQDVYLCSVSANMSEEINKKLLSEEEVHKYYLELD
ncbi:4'-phosphopantetheinyl transferase superfamily protein (plasmid) [Enterocloster clostridioformis]